MENIAGLLYRKETAKVLLERLASLPLDSVNPSEVISATFFAYLFNEDFNHAQAVFTALKPADLLSKPGLAAAGVLLLVVLAESAATSWDSTKLLCEATAYATELYVRDSNCSTFEHLHDSMILFGSGAISLFIAELNKLSEAHSVELAPLLPVLQECTNDRGKRALSLLRSAKAQVEEPFMRKLAELRGLDASHGKIV
ncbi:Hypothetical protein GLP15_1133 [Giardia lamblia P15]|uniref:Ankyrin repeat protein n=1 Tax=Giardia intestinalis (strain P15) TaxID=658858 RepID=E1F8K6_GIAIA|nr:Hypothetical protein GLP15_1133 [Giardia lamblia P15]